MSLGEPIYVRRYEVESRDRFNPTWKLVEHAPRGAKRWGKLSFFLHRVEAEEAMAGLVAYYADRGRDDVEFRVVER